MHIQSLAACLLALLLLGGCATQATNSARHGSTDHGILFRSVNVKGQEHRYAVYVPWNYDPAKPTPTIVFLHGSGECGTDGQKQAVVGLGNAAMFHPQEYPFIIIFPQKPDEDQEWEAFDDLVIATLVTTRSEFTCDPNRTYLTGLSQGGHGTWTIGSLHPDLFAALAPVCSYGSPRRTPTPGVNTDDVAIATKVRHLPIWAFHGAKDDVVPMDGVKSLIASVKNTQQPGDPEPKLTIFPNANHNAWDDAYGNSKLGPWFLTHVKH
ncbi:MAG: PHB depolymerase family esterase [Phycisphaerales bacterium]|jgi:predicted peptidase